LSILLQDLHTTLHDVETGRASSMELDSTLQAVCTAAARIEAFDDEAEAAAYCRRLCDGLFTRSDSGDLSILKFVERAVDAARSKAGTSSAAAALNKAVEAALFAVSNLHIVARSGVSPHVLRIRKTCLYVVQHTRSSGPAQACLAPLQAMLRERLVTASKFMPKEVWAMLQASHATTGHPYHLGGNAQAACFVTLGLLVAVFPGLFSLKQLWTELYARAMAVLEGMWRGAKAGEAEWSDVAAAAAGIDTSTAAGVAVGVGGGASVATDASEGPYASKRLQTGQAAGALEALHLALKGAPGLLAYDDARPPGVRKGSHLLFLYVRNAVRYGAALPGTRIASGIPEFGHRLLMSHGSLFARYILATPCSTVRMLQINAHLAARRKVKALAPGALGEVLRVIATDLALRLTPGSRVAGAGAGDSIRAKEGAGGANLSWSHGLPRTGQSLNPAAFTPPLNIPAQRLLTWLVQGKFEAMLRVRLELLPQWLGEMMYASRPRCHNG